MSKVPGLIWAPNGGLAGPANNPFLEWGAYSGAEWNTGNKHPRIRLVTATDQGVKPAQGKYMYRHELKPGVNRYDNERLELSNDKEVQEGTPGYFPAGAGEWKEGTDVWVAFAFYYPSLYMMGTAGSIHEAAWNENWFGAIPICQFHGRYAAVPTFSISIDETKQYLMGGESGDWYWGTNGTAVPRLGVQTSTTSLLKEPLKPDTWYKFLVHYVVSADAGKGEVQFWMDTGSGMTEHGGVQKLATLNNGSWMYPAMGGPRCEESKASCITAALTGMAEAGQVGYLTKAQLEAEEPPTVVVYHNAWTIAATKAAALYYAFNPKAATSPFLSRLVAAMEPWNA